MGRNDPHGASVASNSIDSTPSVHTAATVVGAKSDTVTVTYASSDGRPITDLAVNGLGSLPSGWSGPATFGCSTVTTGGGGVLNLVRARQGRESSPFPTAPPRATTCSLAHRRRDRSRQWRATARSK